MPIQSSFTPPSTWYTKKQFFERDREAVFLRKNWVAVDVWTDQRPGAFKSGTFLGEPYLLTRNKDGQLRAFYNVCSHAGSCLAGPWTTAQQSTDSSSCLRLSADLVGQSSEGCLSAGGSFQCPYHGWRFNLDGRLTKATQTKGIQNFRAKDYSLKSIPARQLGPIVFLNFGGSEGEEEQGSFDESQSRFSERLYQNGFVPDLSDLQLVESRRYTLQCNWKVFTDNYGDGCYHCGYAHVDLASNIDENSYSTEILSEELTIQQAPPSDADERFGSKTAVYAQWYPNVMLNRYGPWLDIDIVIPRDESTCTVFKSWFLEHDFALPSKTYIEESLVSSEKVHDEDVFLCENVQLGMQSRGFDAGRYVPTKQIATYHFHQRLARDLQCFQ